MIIKSRIRNDYVNLLLLSSIIIGLVAAQCSIAIAEESAKMTNNKIIHIPNQFKENVSYNKFGLTGSATGGILRDPFTNIITTKEILASDRSNSPDIKITVEMPPKPATLDIVLAMDTSGSMVQMYEQKNQTLLDRATEVMNETISQFPEARVSIVSWDDENEAGDKVTPFYRVSGEMKDIIDSLNNLSDECKETDHTVYSIGIKRAIQVMDNRTNWPVDPYNTARIIIFITGLSEFYAEPKNASKELTLDYQLEVARQNRTYETNSSFYGYQIFPVTIGYDSPLALGSIRPFSMEYQNLSKILNATGIADQPSIVREPIPIKNKVLLVDAIKKILDDLKSRPIAYNVRVNDTLYSYLVLMGSENSFVPDIREPITPAITRNPSDGSTTLRWDVGKMNGTEIWQATIHTQLNLYLPVEVSSSKMPVAYIIENTTPASEVNYKWFTKYNGSIGLPEGEIRFPPLSTPSNGNNAEQAMTRLTTKGTTTEEKASKKQPGFEALFAAMGLLMTAYLLRRKS
jgi:hypothetical protein